MNTLRRYRSNLIRIAMIALIATTLINGKCEEKVIKTVVAWLCYIDFVPGCRRLLLGSGPSAGPACTETGCCRGRCVPTGSGGGGFPNNGPFPGPIGPTGSPGEQWQCSPFGAECGKTVLMNQGSRCHVCFTVNLTPTVSLVGDPDPFSPDPIGFDSQAPDTTAPTALYVTAGPLDHLSSVIVQFSESMDPNTISLSGFVNGASYSWARTTHFNDTLTISTQGGWPTGNQSFSVSASDTAGNAATVGQTISIRNLQQEYNNAAAQAEQFRALLAWPPADGPLQQIDLNGNYFQTHAGNVQAIYITPAGPMAVYGDIYFHYLLQGAHFGTLGLPTTSEYDCGLFLRCNDFAHGRFTWQAITRLVTVVHW